jgi:hypothetical protein
MLTSRRKTSPQAKLSRSPIGDFQTFGMLSMREAGYPTGPSSLTAPQQATYEKAWGVETASTVFGGGDVGSYNDNIFRIGFNVHGEVYQESKIHLSLESKYSQNGNANGMMMEWHIDGTTTGGDYVRSLTGTIPKTNLTNLDVTSGMAAQVQLFTFADFNGSPAFVVDSRGGTKKVQVSQGATFDIRGIPDVSLRKNIRQLIEPNTDTWAWLPYIDYTASEIKVATDYPLLVNGRMIAQGRISGTEYWLDGLNYMQVGKVCSSGLVHGYNIDSIGGSPRYAENGNAAGIWSRINTVRFYATVSGTKGNNLPSWGMACSHTAVDDEMYLELLHPRSGTVKRVTVGAADSGGTGFRLLRIGN